MKLIPACLFRKLTMTCLIIFRLLRNLSNSNKNGFFYVGQIKKLFFLSVLRKRILLAPFWVGFNFPNAPDQLQGESSLLTSKSSAVPDTHLLYHGRMRYQEIPWIFSWLYEFWTFRIAYYLRLTSWCLKVSNLIFHGSQTLQPSLRYKRTCLSVVEPCLSVSNIMVRYGNLFYLQGEIGTIYMKNYLRELKRGVYELATKITMRGGSRHLAPKLNIRNPYLIPILTF